MIGLMKMFSVFAFRKSMKNKIKNMIFWKTRLKAPFRVPLTSIKFIEDFLWQPQLYMEKLENSG